MSGKIYWGAPGSYKTSSAIKNDLPEFAFSGRTVVTNVRGLENTEKIKKVLEKQFKKEIPETFEIINVESETKEGREKWAKYFHWAPYGSAFIVDEVQDVWPRKWTTKQIEAFNYPGGPDSASKAKRPYDFFISFDQHRHYNYDYVLTTPHIKKVREDIREICDFAYKHRNQALVGLSKKYNQFGHDPDNNCRSNSDVEQEKIGQSIPSWVFDLYESTTTGEYSDTRSGYKFWKQPKFIILIILFLISWGYAIYSFDGLYNRFNGEKEKDIQQNMSEGSNPIIKQKTFKYLSDLQNLKIYYKGKISNRNKIKYFFLLETSDEKEGSIIDEKFIQTLGYGIVEIDKNIVMIGNDTERIYVKSKGKRNENKMF